MNKNIRIRENIEAVEGKEFRLPIERAYEIKLPEELMKTLNVTSGDRLQFCQDDGGQTYIEKA